ncbi:hypothetical protein B0O99DRAFT_610792 [Bisporella sp. PMI_857]|nr:hypothetical protein B0O99DRAFT_610792 [Bisporella sp. PMI_857]
MTRPEIIRADSIDLQDQNSPSAQDHTRQPTHPAPLGAGPPAPHQAQALRELAAEAADQQFASPRVSREWSNGDNQHFDSYGDDLGTAVSASLISANLQQQDTLAVAQNGGLTGSTAEDAEMADAEGDDGMDDDMMDKISSSPSIDDGGYPFPQLWPQRSTSLLRAIPTRSPSVTQACGEGSSNCLEAPHHYQLGPLRDQFAKDVVTAGAMQNSEHHHLQGEYLDDIVDTTSNYELDGSEHSNSPSRLRNGNAGMGVFDMEIYNRDYDLDEVDEQLSSVDAKGDSLDSDDEGDIDFEFVYALHTFVATVEGQANATKGDTMVLLDDSNSYWWLVRVVKDSSIGYLPAEHIETPTERLARLNKHRNIDTKNPLKKVIRRRNAKNVTFAPPTYVEASDVDYSTDEEDGEPDYYGQNEQQDQDADQQDKRAEEDEITATEPLKVRAESRDVKPESTEIDKTATIDQQRNSDEVIEGKLESSKSRNGTVRNTDSFFKDDTVETRKITLTPNLLRDDSSTSTRTSNDSKEFQKRPSLDKLEKDSTTDKKDKKSTKDKKEKDKKPGMLSGLFKRKDKKSKSQDDDDESLGKRSSEKDRASPAPSKDSEEIISPEDAPMQDIQRNPSKLQKQPRTEMSPVRKLSQKESTRSVEPQQVPAPERPPPADSVQAPSMRLVQSEAGSEETVRQPRDTRGQSPDLNRGVTPVLSAPKEQKPAGTITRILRSASASSGSDSKPIKAKKAKTRMELDDFDSSEENSPIEEPYRGPSKQAQRPIPGAFPDSYTTPQVEKGNAMDERLSESPVEVSPVTPQQSYPPPLMVDSSSQEEHPSPVSSPSPEIIDADEAQDKKASSTTSTTTSTWSDTHLRTFFDDDSDIKDLLVVVYDKSGVVPAGPDHPITGNLFREENAKLADITNRLDGMLGDWLARKMRTQSSR